MFDFRSPDGARFSQHVTYNAGGIQAGGGHADELFPERGKGPAQEGDTARQAGGSCGGGGFGGRGEVCLVNVRALWGLEVGDSVLVSHLLM